MDKKYMVVKGETLNKIMNCFVNEEEYEIFVDGLSTLIDEVVFAAQVAKRCDDEDTARDIALKQLFVFALFCRDNIDVLHGLIATVDYKEVSAESIRSMANNPDDIDYDSIG